MKTKIVIEPGTRVVKFDEKSFFNTILGFNLG